MAAGILTDITKELLDKEMALAKVAADGSQSTQTIVTDLGANFGDTILLSDGSI